MRRPVAGGARLLEELDAVDRNGVGDLPYVSQSLYEDLMDTRPELRLFQLSPAADALDLAAKALPVFAPQPKMADPSPLTELPALPPVRGTPEPPFAANLAAALAMLAVALLLLYMGTRTAFGSLLHPKAVRPQADSTQRTQLNP